MTPSTWCETPAKLCLVDDKVPSETLVGTAGPISSWVGCSRYQMRCGSDRRYEDSKDANAAWTHMHGHSKQVRHVKKTVRVS